MTPPRSFPLVALKRQKILPNASMVLEVHPLRSFWRKKIRGTTSEVQHDQRGHGVESNVEGREGCHCDPACTFQWEKHEDKIFMFS